MFRKKLHIGGRYDQRYRSRPRRLQDQYVRPGNTARITQYLVRDNEPLLFHTGMRSLFPLVKDAVASLIDPSTLKWIGFSHFEADECGSINEWQQVAPQATPVCSFIGKVVSVDDFAPVNLAKGMADGEVLETGKYRFRFVQTPHVPHCWEAGCFLKRLIAYSSVPICCTKTVTSNLSPPATLSDGQGKPS